jgi:hypothetical protein
MCPFVDGQYVLILALVARSEELVLAPYVLVCRSFEEFWPIAAEIHRVHLLPPAKSSSALGTLG